jgi:hypothetical protein
MKGLALSLVVAMTLAACGGGDGDTPPAEDTGPAEVTPDTAPDAEPDTTGDTTDDVATDVPGEVQPPEVADDAEVTSPEVVGDVSDDGTPPLQGDGLLGSPCEEDTDCVQNPEYICFFGFCTERCVQDGNALPGTCQNISVASAHGTQWGCPGDIVYCMPGLVQDKDIICTKDSECSPISMDMVCAGAILTSNKIVDGLCMPGGDRANTGEPCSGNDDCKNLMCMGEDADNGVDGYCTNHCENNGHCLDSLLCTGIGFQTEEDVDESSAWGGYCLDIGIDTDAGEELTYCTSQDKCPDGFHCTAFIEPSSLVAQTWCIHDSDGTAGPGDACEGTADCAGGSCFFGPEVQEGTEGYCSWDCPGGDEDCGEGQACVIRPLHNNGTATDPTDDHKKMGACVFNSSGDACPTDEDWCAGGGVCVSPEGWSESFGQCVIPPTVCEDYCVVAEANCTDENTIVFEVDCVTDCAGWPEGEEGDQGNDSAHCRLYHATVAATDAATHCPHAGPDGGGICVDPVVDLCEGVECDDSIDCTDDSCAEGECSNTVQAVSCLIDDLCYDDGDPNDGNTCKICDVATEQLTWSSAADDTACGEGETAGTCQAGLCEVTDLCAGDPCNDDLACTDDSCDGGACANPVNATSCLISDVCYADAELNDANDCKICDVATDQDTWSNAADDTACGTGETAGTCLAGVCEVDLCAGVVCDNPPGITCNSAGNVMDYEAAGTCAPTTGECGYFPVITDCAGTEVCSGGACVDPTWTADIQPMLAGYCTPCHTSGAASNGSWNTDDYATTQNGSYHCVGLTKAECFSVRITAGTMPTTGSIHSVVTDSGELALLDAWLANGMPEN